jgi:hypothetical protein
MVADPTLILAVGVFLLVFFLRRVDQPKDGGPMPRMGLENPWPCGMPFANANRRRTSMKTERLCSLAALGPAFFLLLSGACSGGGECKMKVSGQSYDSARTCLGPREELGCTDADGCDDALTWAVDEQGRCFFFTNGCVPRGFKIVTSGDSRCGTSSATLPLCSR